MAEMYQGKLGKAGKDVVNWLILLFLVGYAIFMYFIDLNTGWNGFPLSELIARNQILVRLVFAIITTSFFIFFASRKGWTREHLFFSIAWSAALVVSFQNPVAYLHLIFPIIFYFSVGIGMASEGERQLIVQRLAIITLIDFFGYALIPRLLPLISGPSVSDMQFSRFAWPVWLIFALIFSINHTQELPQMIFVAISIFVIGFYFFTMFDGIRMVRSQTDQLDRSI